MPAAERNICKKKCMRLRDVEEMRDKMQEDLEEKWPVCWPGTAMTAPLIRHRVLSLKL
jgi:hypothetical protein